MGSYSSLFQLNKEGKLLQEIQSMACKGKCTHSNGSGANGVKTVGEAARICELLLKTGC